MTMLPFPSASPHFASTSMKRSLSLLEGSGEKARPDKRQRTTVSDRNKSMFFWLIQCFILFLLSQIQPEVVKSHAKIARALGAPSPCPSNEANEPSSAVAAHWGTKSDKQRKEILSKAHVDAERFLREKGMWDKLANVLTRHFTMTLPATTSASSDAQEQEEAKPSVVSVVPSSCSSAPSTQDETVDDIIDIIVNAFVEKNERGAAVPDAAISSTKDASNHALSHVVSTESLVSTSHALAESPKQQQQPKEKKPEMKITLVPNPLLSVPHPLDDAVTPMETPSSTPLPQPTRSSITAKLHVRVPMPFVSRNADDAAHVAPVSPLSNGGSSSRASPTPVPAWCLADPAAYFANELV